MNKENITLVILVSGILFMLYAPSLTSARPEYAVKESRNCPYCHTKEGPPQLNDAGIYYATHNHSFEGYAPTPKPSPTPEPVKEIGVHMNTWEVGLTVFVTILLMLAIVFAIRL